jgi:hypothetical protein
MFNESEWLKLLFLLADTQTWLDDMFKEAFRRLPVSDKKRFIRKTYYLSAQVLAHIIERHYYKINRYPNASKFHISLIEILHFIREAHSSPVTPAPGSPNFERTYQTGKSIGYDKNGQPTTIITILTDAGRRIITAFPGINIQNKEPANYCERK